MKDINLLEFEMWLQNLNEEIVNEAVKIARDYPELTIREVITKAKEVMKC